MSKKEFIGSTIGMMANHAHVRSTKLVRVEFYRMEDGILLVPVSGHNLSVIKPIKQVLISESEFEDRDLDCCDNTVEFFWSIKRLGFEWEDNCE